MGRFLTARLFSADLSPEEQQVHGSSGKILSLFTVFFS